eukprot:scaffold21007_cov107-Isochrysis_galbana.AAC.1
MPKRCEACLYEGLTGGRLFWVWSANGSRMACATPPDRPFTPPHSNLQHPMTYKNTLPTQSPTGSPAAPHDVQEYPPHPIPNRQPCSTP